MNLRRKAVIGVFWSAVQSWGRQIISLVVFAVLARLLGPEVFGQIALAGIFISFVEIFIDQGLSTAIVQREELEAEHLDTAFWINIFSGFILTIISIVCAGFIADIFNDVTITPIIRWLSVGFLLNALTSVQQAIFTRKLNFKALAIRSLVAIVIGGFVGLIMAFNGFGVWSLVGKQITEGFIGVLVLWRTSDWIPKARFSIKHFKELFSFSRSLIATNLFEIVNRQADNFLIGFFLGSVSLGYYTLAYRFLSVATQLLSSMVNSVTLPTFSRLQNEPKQLKAVFYKASQIIGFISFPVFVGMACLAPEIILVLVGKEWLASAPVLQVLSIAGIQLSVSYLYTDIILSMGKASWRLWLNFLNATANAICFLIAVRWGIVAVAVAYTAQSIIIASPFFLYAVRKLIRISFLKYFQQFLSPILGSFGLAIAIFSMKFYFGNLASYNLSSYAIIISCSIVGALVYLIISWYTEPSLLKSLFGFLKIPSRE
jgi:O-antigen/teichoic acid export membrane protein